MIDEAKLRRLLGDEFLEYVLNLDSGAVSTGLTEDGLTEERRQTLEALTVTLLTLIPDESVDPMLKNLQLGTLGMPSATGTSFANELRAGCSGSIDIAVPEDLVAAPLSSMARDIYPLFLLPKEGGPFGGWAFPSLSRALFNHSAREQFEAAVMADPDLKRLFEDEEPNGGGRSGYVLSSAGRGGTVSLWMFPETLIKNTWELLELRGDKPSLSEFIRALSLSIDTARKAVRGETLTTVVRVGLTGVRLPSGVEIRTTGCLIREVRDSDRRDIPESIVGKLTSTNSDGDQVVIDYSGDVVLEFEIPYRIRIGSFDFSHEWPEDLRSTELVDTVANVQLSLLLAVEGNPHQPFVVTSWQKVLDPMAQGVSMGWSDTRRTPNLMPYQLSTSDTDAWKSWLEDVTANRHPSIEVAIRRTIRAATERADPSDALVDAVIAWENLVGSRRGEPTLRISSALAWLLESTVSARRSRQSKVKKLYDLRSDLVHGNRALESREAAEKSRDAMEVSLQALRVLLRDRPELLRDYPDGDRRSNALILG